MASKSKSRLGRNSSSEVNPPSSNKRAAKAVSVVAIKDEEQATLAYKILSAPKTKKLMEADDVEELERLVAEVLEISDIRVSLKSAALLDYNVSALWWSKEQSYNADQTSAFFTVVDTLLSNVEKRQMDLSSNVQELRKMMMGIGGAESQPETEAEDVGGLQTLFDVDQAKKIASYVHQGLFQHYNLYQFLFNDNQMEHVVGIDLDVDNPKSADIPWPSPLCEAVPESVYRQYVQPEEEPSATEKTEEEETSSTADEAAAASADDDREDDEAEKAVAAAEAGESSKLSEAEEADLVAKLSPEQLRQVIDEVCTEMLCGLEGEVATKLRKKENDFIARINQLSVAKAT